MQKLNLYPALRKRFKERVHPLLVKILFCSDGEALWLELYWKDRDEPTKEELSYLSDISDEDEREWHAIYDGIAAFESILGDDVEPLIDALQHIDQPYFDPKNDLIDEARKWLC